MAAKVTVGDLVAQLLKFPFDTRVQTEGCDCTGDCSGAKLTRGIVHAAGEGFEEIDVVLLTRVAGSADPI